MRPGSVSSRENAATLVAHGILTLCSRYHSVKFTILSRYCLETVTLQRRDTALSFGEGRAIVAFGKIA